MSEAIVCVRCGREIECCAFCEAEHTEDSICFRCLIFAFGHAYSYLSGGDEASAPVSRS